MALSSAAVSHRQKSRASDVSVLRMPVMKLLGAPVLTRGVQAAARGSQASMENGKELGGAQRGAAPQVPVRPHNLVQLSQAPLAQIVSLSCLRRPLRSSGWPAPTACSCWSRMRLPRQL